MNLLSAVNKVKKVVRARLLLRAQLLTRNSQVATDCNRLQIILDKQSEIAKIT